MSFTIGSLFDGSGGFPLAASLCGGTPKWSSEIEPYPIAVTKSRFPSIKHLGSVTDIKGGEVEPVDVITFGSPCQDLSVAGKRAGLKHTDNGDDETTRSGLFMEAVRIIKEMREATNGVYPRFALWENVPGAFSSNKGEDFRIVLEELIKVVEPSAVMPPVPEKGWPYADSYCGDGWSIAYRVLDAQFWGVPQRRRRIYLVADFRGECARKVLFEREGLRGYFETSRTPWQTVTGDAEGCFGTADCERKCYGIDHAITTGGNCTAQGKCVYEDIQATLKASGVHAVAYSINHQGGNVEQIIEDKTGTLTAAMNSSGNNKLSVAYSFDALSSNSMKSSNPHSGCRQVDVAKCLDTTDPNPCKNQGGIAVVEQVPYTLKIRSGCEGGGKGVLIQEDLSATLATNNDQYLFQPVGIVDSIGGQAERGWEGECSPCLKASHYKFAPVVAYPAVGVDVYNQTLTGDKAKTLNSAASDADHIPCTIYSIENHPADSRVNIDDSGKVQTLTSRMGTGGGNVPMVMESYLDVEMEVAVRKYEVDCKLLCECLRDHKAASNFSNKDIAEALDIPLTQVEHWFRQDKYFAIPEPEVWPRLKELLGIETDEFDQSIMTFEFKGGNYDMRNRIYTGDVSPTLTCGCGNDLHLVPDVSSPSVVLASGGKVAGCLMASGYDKLGAEEMFSSDYTVIEKHPTYSLETFHCTSEEEKTTTLKARDYKDPICVAIDRAAFNQGQNALYDPQYYTDGTVPTLVARGPGAVAHKQEIRYIVRRLTPTECARLQGFPDTWGHPIAKTELTDEEYQFWMNVRNTHATINGKATKEYTIDQMLKWYNGLHTDSSEYKMWGNGIALPNALYVMQGIADVMSEEKASRKKWLDDLLK